VSDASTFDAEDGEEQEQSTDGGDPNSEPKAKAPDHETEAKKWKAIALKHEAKAKTNADAQRQLDQLKNAGKSETEKLQALLDEERAKARTSTIRALKLSVAAEKGLDAKQAKFLPDLEDEVDMMQAADEILEAFGSTGKAESPTRQPKSNLTNPLKDDDAASSRDALINSMLGKATS
jgi:hypothetical protein